MDIKYISSCHRQISISMVRLLPHYQERCHPAPALRCVDSSPKQYQISLFHDPKTTIAISQSLTKRLSLIVLYSQKKLGMFEVCFWP